MHILFNLIGLGLFVLGSVTLFLMAGTLAEDYILYDYVGWPPTGIIQATLYLIFSILAFLLGGIFVHLGCRYDS